MALIYDNKVFRNLQEQVEKNKADIVDLQETEMVLNAYGIKVVGQVEEESDIPDDFSGDYGDAYLVGTVAPYDVYVWTRPNSETPTDHFVNIGPIAIVGPQGPQGPQGAAGATGAQGIGWVSSSESASSQPEGTFGINATNGNVYQVVSGEWVQVGNIKGQQGAQGQQGATGATGATGPQGPQGPKGDTGSSYQVIGTYASTSLLPDPALVNPGSAALVGASVPYELYIVVGATQEDQLWQDAGVFNDQVQSVPVLEITYNDNLSSERVIALNSSQQSLMSNVLNNGVSSDLVIILHWKDSGIARTNIYRTNFFTASNIIGTAWCLNPGTPGYYSCQCFSPFSNIYFSKFVEVEVVSNKLNGSGTNTVYSKRTSTTTYPSSKAVYDYVQPYADQIPTRKFICTLTGLPDLDGLGTSYQCVMVIYGTEEAKNTWVNYTNGFLNTNYSYTQLINYLTTSINTLGQAPVTNKDNLVQLISILCGAAMLTGLIYFIYTYNNNGDTIQYRMALHELALGTTPPTVAIGSLTHDGDVQWLATVIRIWCDYLTDSNPISIAVTF